MQKTTKLYPEHVLPESSDSQRTTKLYPEHVLQESSDSQRTEMFRITREQAERAGIDFEQDQEGTLRISGNYTPIALFEPSAVEHLRRDLGDRESDRVLDMAAAVVRRETFLNRLRKVME